MVNHLQTEAAFFHSTAKRVMELVQNSDKAMTVVTSKGVGDYATQIDIDVENLIVTELGKHFPGDQILAEEGYSGTAITDGRMWLIDPICGTSNLGKGMNTFCTNIALVSAKQVIASCVVDHSHGEYFWSIGDNNVFVNDAPPLVPAPELGIKIDVDFGSIKSVGSDMRRRHNNCLLKLINDTDYDLISLNTSLGFAYAAIGKTDGFINIFSHPWDIAAASFLLQQSGGVLTGLDGAPWTIATVGAIGGRTPEIHQKLLDVFSNSA